MLAKPDRASPQTIRQLPVPQLTEPSALDPGAVEMAIEGESRTAPAGATRTARIWSIEAPALSSQTTRKLLPSKATDGELVDADDGARMGKSSSAEPAGSTRAPRISGVPPLKTLYATRYRPA